MGDIQQTRGGTNTGSAIDMMRNEFFSPGHARDQVVKIGIVITDGRYECTKNIVKFQTVRFVDVLHYKTL